MGAVVGKNKSVDIDLLNDGYRYALSLCSVRADAEDIVHDAWIRLDRRYGSTPAKSLLYTTIRNLYIDKYRREQRIKFSEFDEKAILPEAAGGERLTTDEMNGFLRQLRDVEREALYLSVVEGYTADEIATMTSTARGTVLSLIHRSKIKMRTLMTGVGIKSIARSGSKVVELVTGETPK